MAQKDNEQYFVWTPAPEIYKILEGSESVNQKRSQTTSMEIFYPLSAQDALTLYSEVKNIYRTLWLEMNY